VILACPDRTREETPGLRDDTALVPLHDVAPNVPITRRAQNRYGSQGRRASFTGATDSVARSLLETTCPRKARTLATPFGISSDRSPQGRLKLTNPLRRLGDDEATQTVTGTAFLLLLLPATTAA
jgi:hypothetical protein